MKYKLCIIFTALVCLAVFASLNIASAYVAPHAGYITQVTWSVTSEGYDQPTGGNIYLDGTQIDTWYNSGGVQTDNGVTSVAVWSDSGVSHTVSYNVDNPSSGSVTAFSGDVTGFVNYYYIQASSTYGTPTISVNGGAAQSLPIYVQSGAGYVVSVASTVSLGSGVQAACTSSASQSFTATAENTVTFNWQIQYQVTFSVSGLDSSATGTVATIDGSAKSYTDLPYTFWANSGTSTSFTYASTVTSSTSGKQFRLSTAYSSPQTITGPVSIADGYVIQYQLAASTTYSTVVGSGWYDAGSTAYVYTVSSQIYSGDYTRYNFASWSGAGSGSYTGTSTTATVTMNGPITETASWQTQYYLTIIGNYAVGTGYGWYNSGATASFDVTSPISGGGSTATFLSWSGSGSGSYSGTTKAATCTMNAPITETATWTVTTDGGGGGGGGGGTTQYYLTITSTYGTTVGGGYYNAGSIAHAGLTSATASGGTGIQYIFSSWSVGGSNYAQSADIPMYSDVTVTASWSAQYYLTVTSPYSTTSGSGWYNAGTSAYATVATNIVTDASGTHTFIGWGSGATGSGIMSNPITMSGPKTALAGWSGTGGSGVATNYTVTLHGPYYESGQAAAGNSVHCSLTYANHTIYQFTLNSSLGVVQNLTVTSTSPFVQLTWNASSTLNYTRIYRFITDQATDDVNLYIPDPTMPTYIYTFSISDFYGMTNPYLESRISPDGVNSYIVERADLSEGGTVTFIMTQYQMYSLSFVSDQGTYTLSFTASIQGTPGQYPVSLNVLAGNFPSATSTSGLSIEANRLNSTTVSFTYLDPSVNTTWVYIKIYHIQGVTQIVDYDVNTTGNVQLILWQLADPSTDYYVYVEAYQNGELIVYTLPTSNSYSSTSPFSGILDFLGQHTGTLPYVQTGWPDGMTTNQIAQTVVALIVMLFLCVGSFKSAGACCLVSWIIFGVMLYLGWYGAITPYTIPMFAISGVFAALIMIDENKSTVPGAA